MTSVRTREGGPGAAQARGARPRLGAGGALALTLLLGLSCHGSAQTSAGSAGAGEARPDPAAVVERARIFLILPHDAGRTGARVACDDSAVAVEASLPQTGPALPGALRALLALHDRFDRGSGLLNQLYASHLDLAGIERQGAQAVVRLTGYVESGDPCDNQRILAELRQTVLQFDGLSEARFELDGQPLADLLAGRAAALPPPAPATPAQGATPAGAAPPSDALPPRPPDSEPPPGTPR